MGCKDRKLFTREQIERIAANECVRYVGERTIILTLDFKRRAYEAWERDPHAGAVRSVLAEAGLDEAKIGHNLSREMSSHFSRFGAPTRSGSPNPSDDTVVPGAGLALEPGRAPRPGAASTGRKSKDKRTLTSEQIERIAANECVRYVGERTLILTVAARTQAYEAWERDRDAEAVREFLAGVGLDEDELGYSLSKDLSRHFAQYGRPRKSNSPRSSDPTVVPGAGLALELGPDGVSGWEARRALVESGAFATTATGRFWPSAELEDSLFASWPETPVADGLEAAGYDESLMRGGLAKRLEAAFGDARRLGTSPAESRRANGRVAGDTGVPEALAAPDGSGGVACTEALARSLAPLAGIPVDDALDAHLVDHRLLSVAEKRSLAEAAAASEPSVPDLGGTVLEAEVLRRRAGLLERVVLETLEDASGSVPAMSPAARKGLCLWAASLPADPGGRITRGAVRERLGISRTSYYRYVGDANWGTSELDRADRAERDARAVEEAFRHRGFRKGARQVYMLIPRLGHRKVGLRRVRQIMRDRGLSSGVRGPNPSRRAAAAHEAGSVAPDLLRRRFRLHRPNEVRVTDVTTIDYGDGLRAYGSALMDPVTSVLVAFVVSERNDLELALRTLSEGDRHPCEDGGILHSDQGVLYKATDFMAEVLERGLERSMSKRGNCWDNAVVESFFGHFKDECDYASCADAGALRALVADYADYYNSERGQWGRMRMTPLEHEAWLESLDDDGFAAYLEREEAEWESMRERAAELARKRYGTLGTSRAQG